MKKNGKILIIGAVPHADNLKSYGGTTILMQNFIDYCREHGYRYRHIDTMKYRNKPANMIYFIGCFIWGVLTSRIVMYNVARNGAFTLFYYTAPLCYLLKRRVVFRMFGGNFLDLLNTYPKKKARMISLLNKAHTMFFETKILMDSTPDLFDGNVGIKWFPNCRKPSDVGKKAGFSGKFVFMSRIVKDKGVDYLIDVAERLPEEYTVHLYGPLDKDYAGLECFDGKKAEYHGAVNPDGIFKTLAGYDVLVLPTFWKAEGYPGIIIEAMSMGMPVISTRIGGIPEMVADGVNGILLEPHDATALREAILSFDRDNYEAMSVRATECFNLNYNSDVVNERVWKTMTAD